MSTHQGEIHVEQLRLLLGGVKSTMLTSMVLLLLLSAMLWPGNAPAHLAAWGALTLAGRLGRWWYATDMLRAGFSAAEIPKIERYLTLLSACDGAAWGSLGWAALESATPAGQVLLMSSLAAISNTSMFALAPSRPACVAMPIGMLLTLGSALISLSDKAYSGLVLACALYILAVYWQVEVVRQIEHEAIQKRFENRELLAQLKAETERTRQALLDAERANVAKTRFLAAASHDLRQPIHALGLFLEALAHDGLGSPQREVLENAKAASQSSMGMLNTLLDFSRLDAGVVVPRLRSFALQPLLNKLENELAPQANAANLVYRTRETALAVNSDPALVEQMLRNLINNAIRYTHSGGILIGCRRRGAHVMIEVIDTGIGIAPEHHEEIFREFHQLGNPERDRRHGLGLGLAIIRGLANTLHCNVSLISRPGHGSIFRVELPLAQSVFSDMAPWPAEPACPVACSRLAGLRVIVLDDDEAVRQGMQHLLASWGSDCRVACTVEEAADLLVDQPADLLISDYRLGGGWNGADAIEHLRTLQPNGLPAMIVTGDTAPQRLREAISSGIPLLHKPVEPARLLKALREVIPAV